MGSTVVAADALTRLTSVTRFSEWVFLIAFQLLTSFRRGDRRNSVSY